MLDADHLTPEAIAEFEANRAVYLAQAQETYPSARARFLSGLPVGTLFMVAKFATDDAGHETLLLTEVEGIANGQVFGREYQGPAAPRASGPSVSFLESEVVDWLIQAPGGEIEGWYLGKFLYEAHTGTSLLDSTTPNHTVQPTVGAQRSPVNESAVGGAPTAADGERWAY